MRFKRPFDVPVWIAISEAGYPAPFIGYAYQRKMLSLEYERLHGCKPQEHGYRLVKVRLSEAK